MFRLEELVRCLEVANVPFPAVVALVARGVFAL